MNLNFWKPNGDKAAESRKWKQYLILLGLIAGAYLVFLLLISGGSSTKKKTTPTKDQVATTHVLTPGSQIDPRDAWIGGAGAAVAEQGSRLTHQEQLTKALQDQVAKLQRELQERGKAAPIPPKEKEADGAAKMPEASPRSTTEPSDKAVPPPAKSKIDASVAYPPSTPGKVGASLPFNLPPGVSLPPGVAGATATPAVLTSTSIGIGHFSMRDTGPVTATKVATTSPAASAPAGSNTVHKTKDAGTTFLPIGFMKATLLGGIDAPTNGQGQSNPRPIMLHIDDMAVLPNMYRAHVEKCLLVGAAYGDIPSERAYIRLEKLSCIRNDKRVLETKIQGVIYGEDGKLGMRGRLVTKQGKILYNALLAGGLAGIGQGLQTNYSSSTVTGLGSIVQMPTEGKAFEAGIGAGIGRALDRLANYYISLAEKTFPVIEIDSMRHVDVAITSGVELDVPLPSDIALEDNDE